LRYKDKYIIIIGIYTEKIMAFSNKVIVYSIWGCTEFKYSIRGENSY